MSALSVEPPFPAFADADGQPLDDGYIFIGTVNLNPITNPIVAFFDSALTITAVQPIRTSGGYPVYQGTPANIFVNSDYSIQVQNKNGSVVYSSPSTDGRYSANLISFTGFKGQVGTVQNLAGDDGSDWIGFDQANESSVARSAQDKMQDLVSVKDFGAVGDSSTDDTAALNACALYCLNNKKTIFIPAGTYKITSSIKASCPIAGVGPTVSIIKNYGTGDALDLSGSNYYTTFQNFGVDGSGNIASRDGISLYNTTTNSGNPSYCFFFAVHSNNNGRHGLYHRYAWATRYSQCMFTYNAGIGVYEDTRLSDAGTANCVTFFQCDSRHNGGTNTGFGSDFGGVKVKGAQGFSWIGGIIESNNGFGVYIGDAPGGVATRLVHFKQTYFEYNGYGVTDGANFYVTGPWANLVVEDCWIAHGTTAGNTNTVYFIGTSLDGGNFVERNNTLNNVGTGGTTNIYGGAHLAAPRTALGSAPTVYAYQNVATTLSVPTSTFTKIPLDVESWDSNNNFNTTLYRFTPTVAGYYRINARLNYFPSGGTNFFVSIFQNAAEVYRGMNVINVAAAAGADVDCMVYANGSTDYFEFYVFQTSGSTQSYTPSFALCGMQIDYARNP
jgi:hypothetical protein